MQGSSSSNWLIRHITRKARFFLYLAKRVSSCAIPTLRKKLLYLGSLLRNDATLSLSKRRYSFFPSFLTVQAPPPKKARKGPGPVRVPKGHSERYRSVVVTLNNFTVEEYEWWSKPDEWTTKPLWVICGKEMSSTGTPHLQCAIAWGRQIALSTMKKLPGLARAHIEQMRGSHEQSLAYCSKSDPAPLIWGQLPKGRGGGRSASLENAINVINNGGTLADIARDNGTAIVKHYRGLTVYRSLVQGRRDPQMPPCCIWIKGGAGSGKTWWSWELGTKYCGSSDGIYISSDPKLKWFDGYDCQQVAIIDDFRAKHVEFAWLLRLTDRYPVKVEWKGGHCEWKPSIIIFSCPYPMRKVFETRFKYLPEDMEQLYRRFKWEFDLSKPEDKVLMAKVLSETSLGFIPTPEGPCPGGDGGHSGETTGEAGTGGDAAGETGNRERPPPVTSLAELWALNGGRGPLTASQRRAQQWGSLDVTGGSGAP